MPIREKIAAILLIPLVILAGYTYVNFSDFAPKKLVAVEEVKGAKKENDIRLPYPETYEIISEDRTENTKQITLTSTKTPEEVQAFYKNVMEARDFKLRTSGEAGIFFTSEYKNLETKVEITSSPLVTGGKTVVSIKVTY